MSASPTEFDIAIVGGGMVGASLALALAQAAPERPLRIALFEAFALPQQPQAPLSPSYDARSTALAYGSRLLLEPLGVWGALAATAMPITRIEVSDRGHCGGARINARQQRVPALGYVVENRQLGQALLGALAEQASVQLFSPATVTRAEVLPEGVQLSYVDAADQLHQCRTGLLVVADGGRSALCQQLQLEQQETPYQQVALIANVTLDRPHRGCAFERFTAAGPMALLPLSDTAAGAPRAALVWSVPLEQADAALQWSEREFLARLHESFGYRAGAFIHVGERHSYPLKLSRVREQSRRGVVVLGNAAHTLHPIAGQGFNLALRGALALVDSLVAQHRRAADLGDPAMLQAFVDSQRWDQDKTIGFSDQVTRLFSNDHPALAVARNLGLLGLDLLPPLKRAFALSAMGLDRPSPSFLQELIHEH
ncbi:MAG TPA: 2-octaprenyl-6-methoxyphenyl hydroxylase [Motiliproteus sp.]